MQLSQLRRIVLENIENASFNVLSLANKMNLSERHLGRRVKSSTGITIGQFIRGIKLERAQQLLRDGSYATVVEVAKAVGFEKTSYFSQIYYQQYGIKPSEYFNESRN